jgi:putative ATPase
MADPTALQVAIAAARALEFVGLPEARLALAQAVIHCTLAPKSNAVIVAYERAAADVREGLTGPVPAHLRDAHYPGAAKLGSGQGYRYPHDFPGGVVAQQYAPDVLAGRTYYLPTEREPAAAERSDTLRSALRQDDGTKTADPLDDASG